MRHFNIRSGEWPSSADVLPRQIMPGPPTVSAAILGHDVPDLRPRFAVEQGAHVTKGEVLFRDRKHPQIAFVAPISGTVTTLAYGPQKTLSACIVTAIGSTGDTTPQTAIPDDQSPDAIRAALQDRGLWPAFLTRPFGRIPAPGTTPAAIFINATRSAPQSPDPVLVLADRSDDFAAGTILLTHLTNGPVIVCQSPGDALAPQQDRIHHASFSGTLAAGLSGTHIDCLFPVNLGRPVWTIGYQDVAAIGHLFRTGQYQADRVVAVTGPLADPPRLVQTCLGANIAKIAAVDGAHILTGDASSGHEELFLGRYHQQITVLPAAQPQLRRRWFSRLSPAPRALIPTRTLERALAPDIPPVPLLRALSIGDSEAAERLGCLALIEEDVAALTRYCTSGADYGRLLRHVLDELKADAA